MVERHERGDRTSCTWVSWPLPLAEALAVFVEAQATDRYDWVALVPRPISVHRWPGTDWDVHNPFCDL